MHCCKNSVKLLYMIQKLSPVRCEFIMTEKPFEIDINVVEKGPEETPFAGLIPFVQMCEAMKLAECIDENLNIRNEKGYKDSEHVLSIITMQITEGSTVDDLTTFKNKFGLENLPFRIPSPSSTREYMGNFHNAEEESKQKQGSVYIPKENEHLEGFQEIHAFVFQQAYTMQPKTSITLDQDATFIETETKDALYNYHGEKSYSAFNTYCPEYDIVVGTQFRDGNVNAGYGQLEELKRILSYVPAGIEKINLRSDSAGYQEELMKYCAEGKDERFGVIDFTTSCPVTKEFREAVKKVPEEEWKPVLRPVERGGIKYMQETGQEYAEVVYVPQWAGNSKNGAEYRFIAIRESFKGKMSKKDSPGQLPILELIEDLEQGNEKIKKLHLTELKGNVYKIFGIVTDIMERDGGELVLWHHERCGKSEEVHRILKDEVAGGHVASRKFGANAAWWNIAVLAFSLLNMFKRNFLPKIFHKSRPKSLRFHFFTTIGRIVNHARKKVLNVYARGRVKEWFLYARDRLMSFCAAAG